MKPPDDKIRTAIQNEKTKNVTVQASAGTGKTTLMVDRVLALIENGIPIEELVVVTFTNAAAAELRSRIREKLENNSSRMAQKALSDLSIAWIGTIHSFASRLLKEMFHFTGADPSFRVMDGHFTQVEIERKWDIWLHGLSPAEFTKYKKALVYIKDKTLREIVIGLESLRWAESRDCLGHVDEICTIPLVALEKEVSNLLKLCLDKSDIQYGNAKGLHDALLKINAAPAVTASEMLKCAGYSMGGGKKKCWENDTLKDKIKPFLTKARKEILKMAEVIESEDLTTQVWELTYSFALDLRDEWDADKSRLSFNDLLFMAWKAIADKKSGLQSHLQDKFKHVMIDEFQDTSKGQVELFTEFLVKSKIIPPGKITIVADDKQSIYGWRNADIETYKQFCDSLKSNGALSETITTNFRSTKNIIEFVNIFGENLFGSQTPAETPFGCNYSNIYPPGDAADGEIVEVKTIPKIPDAIKNRYSQGEYGARLQAIETKNYIKQKMQEGELPEDFALLLKSTTDMHHYVNEFELANIPYFVEATREFRTRPEIIDLREIINCLLNPLYSLSWVHTLRSYFFGISDKVINKAIVGGTMNFIHEEESCPEEIVAVNKHLRRLRESITHLPLSDFVYELYLQSDLIPIIAASGYQEARRLSNLQFILEEIQAGDITTVSELLRYLDEDLGPTRTEEPSTLPEKGGAVTITTVHRAKGLGWKHVIFAAPTKGGGNRGVLISYEHEEKVAFNLGITLDFEKDKNKMRTPYWHSIKETEKARRLAEDRRLIYVAITRAKNSLLLFTTPPPKKENPNSNAANIFRDCIEYVKSKKPELIEVSDLKAITEFPSDVSRKPNIALNNDFKKICSTEFYSITAKQQDAQTEGAKIGDMVHGVMEKISFSDPQEWFAENEGILKERLAEYYEEVKKLALNFFEMKLPFAIDKSEIIGREYPYIVQTDGRVKQRYIDLLLDDGDELIVVDYKTDKFNGRTAEEVGDEYSEKQEYYLKDISEFFGKSTRGYLVFLREDAVHEITPNI